MPTTYNGSVVTVYIPIANEQDYVSGSTSLSQSLQNLADHDHSANPLGSSSIAAGSIGTTQLANGSVTSAKLASGITIGVVANDTFIQARNAANSADVDLIKLNTSDNLHVDPLVDNLVLSNNVSLEGRNAADSADVAIVKVDTNNDLSFGAEVSSLKMKTSTYITSRNNADSGNLNMWKTNTSDLLEPGIGINFNSQNMTNVDIDSGTIDDCTITLGSGSLNASGATLTLDDNQISGDKVEGGTINAISITTLTSSSVLGTTFDTNVTTAGVTLSGTTLAADGTDSNIDINITPKGSGVVNVDNLTLDGNTLGSSSGAINITPVAGSAIVLDTSVSIDGGAVDITGDLDVDNLNLNGNTISSSNTNGNVTINPNGSGVLEASCDVLPETDSTHDLGSSSKAWAEIHSDSITLGGNTSLTGYKEGTFTPTIGGTGADPTSITYTNQDGEYTRIGRLVFFTIRITVNALTLGAASGTLEIRGLPYTCHSSYDYYCSMNQTGLGIVGPDIIVGRVQKGTTKMIIVESTYNAGSSSADITDLAATDNVYFTGHYVTTDAF